MRLVCLLLIPHPDLLCLPDDSQREANRQDRRITTQRVISRRRYTQEQRARARLRCAQHLHAAREMTALWPHKARTHQQPAGGGAPPSRSRAHFKEADLSPYQWSPIPQWRPACIIPFFSSFCFLHHGPSASCLVGDAAAARANNKSRRKPCAENKGLL